MKASFFTAVVGFISVCAVGCATTQKFDLRVRSWEGKDATTLLKTWGQPDATENLVNGNRVYLYSRLRHEPFPAWQARRTIANTGKAVVPFDRYLECATYFEATPKNKIVSVEYRGDDCKWKD